MTEHELREKLQRKLQFFHHGCPADFVVDGQADLDKCTCGINDAITDILPIITQYGNAREREGRIDEQEAMANSVGSCDG